MLEGIFSCAEIAAVHIKEESKRKVKNIFFILKYLYPQISQITADKEEIRRQKQEVRNKKQDSFLPLASCLLLHNLC
jgi:hypothetical protein